MFSRFLPLLLEGYKKLFSEADITKDQDTKNEFVKAFLQVMKNQATVVAGGINAEGAKTETVVVVNGEQLSSGCVIEPQHTVITAAPFSAASIRTASRRSFVVSM